MFLLLGLTALVVLILWLGQQGKRDPTRQYSVQIETDVNGLANGSTVRYLGVSVGTVLNIALESGVNPHVEVLIAVQQDLPINETTYATLVVQGVTGIAIIDLGSDAKRPQPRATNATGIPVIPFRSTGLSAVLAGGGEIANGAQQLIAQLNTWSSDENLNRVQTILEDIDKFTEALANQREQIPQIVASLNSFSTRIDTVSKLLETTLTENLPGISADLKHTSEKLSSITTKIDGLLAENEGDIDRLLGEGFASTSDLVIDLKALADNLSDLSRELREDPSRLVYRARHDPVVAQP